MTTDVKTVMSGSIPVGSYAMIYDILRIEDATGRRFIVGQNFTHPTDNLAGGGNYDSLSDAYRFLHTFAKVGAKQARARGWISALEAMDAMQRIEDAKVGWELEAMEFELRDILGICLTDSCEAVGNRKARRAAKVRRRH